jgi:hypothetical protein
MKVFSIISFYIFIRLFIGEGILANPIFKMHLDTNIYQSNFKVCSTSGFYDANTAVTFLGDSRIDLVDNIAYGAASLDHYFATYGAWNVQNFGVSGMDSYGLKDQIQTCFRRDPSNPHRKTNFTMAIAIKANPEIDEYFKITSECTIQSRMLVIDAMTARGIVQ